MKRLAMVAVALMAAALSVCTPAAAQTTDAVKLQVAGEMVAAWKAKDWRKVADLFTEDGSLRSMMDAPVVGREVIYKRISALGGGIDSIVLDVSHMGIIDGLVFIERVDRFSYKGKQGAVPVVGVLQFKGDRISEWREYYDRDQLLTQMGVAPAPAKPPH